MTYSVMVAALTSHDEAKLERLIQSVRMQLDHDINFVGVVVCNTLNDDYVPKALAIAYKYGWDFIRTSSNGKPGKGKNSVLKLFRNEAQYKNCTHVLMMDGDDFLYPCAFQQIQHALRSHCDILGLQTNDILDGLVYNGVYHETVVDQKTGQSVFLYSWFEQQHNIYAQPAHYQKVVRTNKLGEHSTPDRVILVSRAAAPFLRCSEDLPVYEDYILSLSAQVAHLVEGVRYYNTSCNCIYVYDKTGETSTCKEYNKAVGGDWSAHEEMFKNEISVYEPFLKDFHASQVPFIHIPQPEGFDKAAKINFLSKNLLLLKGSK